MPKFELAVAEDSYQLGVSEDTAEWSSAEHVEMHVTGYPEYDGPTEFVPTGEYQVIHVAGRAVVQDIVVDPIPSNYGLITYDGSKLTVS